MITQCFQKQMFLSIPNKLTIDEWELCYRNRHKLNAHEQICTNLNILLRNNLLEVFICINDFIQIPNKETVRV